MSYTDPGGGSSISNGYAEWDSLDFTPEVRPKAEKQGLTITQRAAIHEFGHMLGYRDEYAFDPTVIGDKEWTHSSSHRGDTDSIMYWGEVVEPRHYVLLADWISLQWIKKDPANCKGHDWKVKDGSTLIDMTNAQL
jgi:hypothetical protein